LGEPIAAHAAASDKTIDTWTMVAVVCKIAMPSDQSFRP
jgi:hypothetical protein